MKKIFLVIAIFSLSITNAQDSNMFNYGVIIGVNYGSTDDLNISGGFSAISETIRSDKKTGYHAGLFFQINFNNMYVRPEVIYSLSKANYNDNEFSQEKIEIPLLYGFTVLKPISVFLGPSLQYTLTSDFTDVEFDEIDIKNELAVNAQIGIALQLGKQIRLDARYQRGISENIVSLEQDIGPEGEIYEFNAKPEQFIFTLSLQL